MLITKAPLQSVLSFKVTERRVKRPQFGGAKLGPSRGNGAGAARGFRLQPITSSSPPLFSIAHRPDFKSRYSTERLSDQGRWRAMRWLGPTGTLRAPKSRTHQRASLVRVKSCETSR
jgi:hypothetical protein